MTRTILALAAIAVAVIALRPRRPVPLPESDDSEAVMVPMTWVEDAQGNAWTYHHGEYIQFAPTSRN